MHRKRLQSGFTSLTIISLLAAGAIVAVILLLVYRQLDSNAAVGFLGVIFGGGITTATNLLTARDVRRQQLALAAVERRLQTHQSAYALWHRIVRAVYHSDQDVTVIQEANDWWMNNCLFLDPKSRKALRDCILFASSHKDLLTIPRSDDEDMVRNVKESWDVIMKPGQTLPRGVALPDLGESENPPDIKKP